MGLLPCLRRGSDRWWLPRSDEATEAIGLLMLAAGRGGEIDAPTRTRVQHTIESDPALLIFSALNWPHDQVGTDQLVDWLAENATNRFASGDAFLGVPLVSSAMVQRWKKLRDHFRTIPTERWLDDAALWLEVSGPRVSKTWSQLWPQVVTNSNGSEKTTQGSSNCMLQQLARVVQRQQSIQQTFDRRLEQTKLGAIKQLAYGLSHEINNPLANISTRAQQLQRVESDETKNATLQRIIDQVYRAHEMIADLMFYANPPAIELIDCDLSALLDQVVSTFEAEAKRQEIRLEVITPDEPVELSVDENMVHEAVRALIRNSVEAIGCQGTIIVSVICETDRIKIHVADSGPGLTDEAREHAFDPYFSGREAGRGLGLGLCRAYRIARLHRGEISLASGPTGCVATISLPISPQT